MSNIHIKRIATPRTWGLPRKSFNRKKMKFASKPTSGKELGLCMAINNVLRDLIGVAKTNKEVKALLQFKHVFVNGKRVRDDKFPVGLFDVISFEEMDACYRLTLSQYGKIVAVEIDAKEKDTLVKKLEGKTILKGKKVQLNLSGSSNLLVDKNEGSVGDLMVIKKGKVEKTVSLAKGVTVMLTAGKHIGTVAKVADINDAKLFIEVDGKTVETSKSFAYVIGEKTPVVKVVA